MTEQWPSSDDAMSTEAMTKAMAEAGARDAALAEDDELLAGEREPVRDDPGKTYRGAAVAGEVEY